MGVVTSTIVETTEIEAAVQRFAAVADPTRLRILAVLSDGCRCACDLQTAVEVAPNLLSYHLRVLREAGLIEGTRRGRWIDYRISPPALLFVTSVLGDAGIGATPPRATCRREAE